MRSRDWRRQKEKQKILKRLKGVACQHMYRTYDANDNWIQSYNWMDIIGTSTHYMYKTHTTKHRYKNRWGKGKKVGFWSSNDSKTRVFDKRLFKKMLDREYDIKSFNISYGFIQNNTEG